MSTMLIYKAKPAQRHVLRCVGLLAAVVTGDALATAAAPPSFASCFVLQPGVELATAVSRTRIANTRYADTDVIAMTVTLSEEHGGGTAVQYHDPGTYQSLGIESTRARGLGVPDGEIRFPSLPPYPGHVAPATKIQSKGTPLAKRIIPLDADVTFVGFDTIELPLANGPRTFDHTCHLRIVLDGGRVDYWYAKGFGVIRTDFTLGEGPVRSNPVISITEGT